MTTTNALADAIAVTLNMERDAAGWSLERLAKELGLSEQTLGRYLTRRERDIPISVVTRTAAIIGVPLRDIVAAAERRVARDTTPPSSDVG